MKRGGGLDPARPDWWPPAKRPRATPGGLIADCLRNVSRPVPCAPVLAHVLFFGLNPRGSADFLAYPVPRTCQWVVLATSGFEVLSLSHAQPRVLRQLRP